MARIQAETAWNLGTNVTKALQKRSKNQQFHGWHKNQKAYRTVRRRNRARNLKMNTLSTKQLDGLKRT